MLQGRPEGVLARNAHPGLSQRAPISPRGREHGAFQTGPSVETCLLRLPEVSGDGRITWLGRSRCWLPGGALWPRPNARKCLEMTRLSPLKAGCYWHQARPGCRPSENAQDAPSTENDPVPDARGAEAEKRRVGAQGLKGEYALPSSPQRVRSGPQGWMEAWRAGVGSRTWRWRAEKGLDGRGSTSSRGQSRPGDSLLTCSGSRTTSWDPSSSVSSLPSDSTLSKASSSVPLGSRMPSRKEGWGPSLG